MDIAPNLENGNFSLTNGTLSSPRSAPDGAVYQEAVIGDWIMKLSPPILLVLGTLGNAFSIIVLQRKALQATSSALYLTALAVVDTVVLYIGLLHYWTLGLGAYDIRNLSGGVCKLHTFLLYTFNDMSVWILVAVTFQRLVSVRFPLQAKTIATRKVAKMSILVFFILLSVVNSHFFWTLDVKSMVVGNITRKECTVSDMEHMDFLVTAWPWVDFCVFSFVPFLLLLVSNSAIIYQIVVNSPNRTRMASGNVDFNVSGMTTMLVAISIVFLLLTSPVVIYFIGRPYWIQTNDQRVHAQLWLFGVISHLLQYTNNAVNFILYCVTGPVFRRELAACFNGKAREISCPLMRDLAGSRTSLASSRSSSACNGTTAVSAVQADRASEMTTPI